MDLTMLSRAKPLGRRWPRRLALRASSAALLCGLVTVASWAQAIGAGEQPQTGLPRVTLRAGMHLIDAQVASTHAQRMTGLMWRRELAPNEGMLFVFDAPAVQCFWMRNTYVPLTAAFIADDGRIVNLADMQPLDETSHCSAEPVRYVLEMTRGWFRQRGIGPGFRLAGPPFGRR
jgi:uncharacterized membrane protein (UPF0127 family)